MNALFRYPKSNRREKARQWAHRSNASQASARIDRPTDPETLRMRALDDARGQVLRSGVCWKEGKELHWQVRRSVLGRVNQFDLVSNGRVILTAGIRKLPTQFRPRG